MHYLFLIVAIISEVIGTLALKSSEGFTHLRPSLLVVLGYGAAFYFLSLCLHKISVGIAYAIWAGLGTVLIAVLGFMIHKQKLDLGAVIGLILILSGVVVINLFSKSVVH